MIFALATRSHSSGITLDHRTCRAQAPSAEDVTKVACSAQRAEETETLFQQRKEEEEQVSRPIRFSTLNA